MKRLIKVLLTIMAAMVSISCLDEISNLSAYEQELTFSAFFQSETKTQLTEENNVSWIPGDQIAVSGASEPFTADIDEPSDFARFAGSTQRASVYHAVYPYSLHKSWEGSVATVLVPQVQDAIKGTFADDLNISVAKTSADDLSFEFHNVLGYVKFTVTENTGNVKSVVVKAIGGEPLAGHAEIDCSSDTPRATAKKNMQDHVMSTIPYIDYSVSLVSEDTLSPGNYYIALLPGTYRSGLQFTFIGEDGRIATKEISKELVMCQGQIKSVGEISGLEFNDSGLSSTDIPENEIWYTSSSGRKISPNPGTEFGSQLISNEYKDGRGVMRFDGPVTVIGADAFSNFLSDEARHLTNIIIPPAVETIGQNAFYQCNELTSIKLPNSLKRIEGCAFMYNSLYEITIPDSVEEFSPGFVKCCFNLKEIRSKFSTLDRRCMIVDGTLVAFASYGITEYDLPEGIHTIGESVFQDQMRINRIGFPQSLKVIEAEAFDRCGLLEVTVPEGVTEIGNWAFRNNDYLESIHFPGTLEYLGQTVIGMCPRLSSITGKYASSDNKAIVVDGEIISVAPYELYDYTIPDGVHTIGSDLFWDNDNIRKIVVTEGVRNIKRGAFYGCENLAEVYIPSTIESIGYRILGHSFNLEKITGPFASDDGRCLVKDDVLEAFAPKGILNYVVPDNVKEIRASVFGSTWELESVILPEGLEIIDEDAFRICPNLSSVTIPSTVKSIGNSSGGLRELFYSCQSLTRLICKAVVPPDLLVPLSMPEYAVIYVPEESLEQYENHPEWSRYNLESLSETDDSMYESTDYSKDGEVAVLHKASVGNGIDVVILGDGFSDRLIDDGTYMSHVASACDALFSEEPYRSFKDMFNVSAVYAVSKNEVFTSSSETALSTNFGVGTTVGGDLDACRRYAYKCALENIDETLIIVLVNTEEYVGTCYMWEGTEGVPGSGSAVAFVPVGGSDDELRNVLLHEAGGHGFAKLADEYYYEGTISETEIVQEYERFYKFGWWKNVDFTSDASKIKWADFLTDERYKYDGLGVYEGACTYMYGAFRPTENSIMRYNTGGFNAPSREAIWYRIHKLAYGDSWEYDYEEFVEWDAINRKTSALTPQKARQNYVEKAFEPTSPPVVVGKSWRKYSENMTQFLEEE